MSDEPAAYLQGAGIGVAIGFAWATLGVSLWIIAPFALALLFAGYVMEKHE